MDTAEYNLGVALFGHMLILPRSYLPHAAWFDTDLFLTGFSVAIWALLKL